MSTALVVLAKAPVAGLAKTRLIPALGAEGAAALARRLLLHTVQEAGAAGFEYCELCVTPTTDHPAFAEAAHAADTARAARGAQTVPPSSPALQLTLQGDGDLGARMHRAFARLLPRHDQVLLVGTDAPALDHAILHQARAALRGHLAVFVPAFDGGYALVGLTRPQPQLFESMAWSTAQVLSETRRRAREAGISWAELPPVHDIDEPVDLAHLPEALR